MLETSKDLLVKFKKNERGREKSRGRKKVAAFSRNGFSLDLLINGFPPEAFCYSPRIRRGRLIKDELKLNHHRVERSFL